MFTHTYTYATAAVVGFERTEYTVDEDEGYVEVCVVLISPNETSFFIDGEVTSVDGEAKSMSI